jgi:hypothetical protein
MSPLPLDRIARRLAGVPRAAYSVPHVYPSAAPAFVPAPMAERPPLRGHQASALRARAVLPVPLHVLLLCGPRRRQCRRHVALRPLRSRRSSSGSNPARRSRSSSSAAAHRPRSRRSCSTRCSSASSARAHPDGSGVHTVETSPETISPEHIAVLRRRGIGRVSMGIQSLDAEVLGTGQSPADARAGPGRVRAARLVRARRERRPHLRAAGTDRGRLSGRPAGGRRTRRARRDALQPARHRADGRRKGPRSRRAVRPGGVAAVAGVREAQRGGARLHADALAHVQATRHGRAHARAAAVLRRRHVRAISSASA